MNVAGKWQKLKAHPYFADVLRPSLSSAETNQQQNNVLDAKDNLIANKICIIMFSTTIEVITRI
jgi:hypothetical protein